MKLKTSFPRKRCFFVNLKGGVNLPKDLSTMEALFEAMTDDLKSNVEKLFNVAEKDKEKTAQLIELVKDRIKFVSEESKKYWKPSINYKKCENCKECMNFCSKVYCFNNKKNKIEIKGENCELLCKSCQTVCKHNAIDLPNRKDMLEYFYIE
ncbi:hypothetical protein DP145_10785 [Clostridium tetani]|nr:hypothetical protein DP126_10565 [Clostridium tetani]RXM60046.1 hypothetical protein DP138_10305 [Clostridium tetani]RXM65231.1 hypothetical protein DP145_10785 [Clostridium tetani]